MPTPVAAESPPSQPEPEKAAAVAAEKSAPPLPQEPASVEDVPAVSPPAPAKAAAKSTPAKSTPAEIDPQDDEQRWWRKINPVICTKLGASVLTHVYGKATADADRKLERDAMLKRAEDF